MAHDIKKVRTSLETALTYLCRTQVANFYGYVVNSFERVFVPGLGTFGVMPKGNRYVLMVDPEYCESLCFEELLVTCKHEVIHCVLQHGPRGLRMYQMCEDDAARRLFLSVKYRAADAAANEVLRMSDPKIADPKKPLGYWVLAENLDLPRDGTYEQYVEILADRAAADQDRAERIWNRAMTLASSALQAVSSQGKGDPTTAAEQLGMPGSKAAEESGATFDTEELADPGEEAEAQALAAALKQHAGELFGDHVDPARPSALDENGKAHVKAAVKAYSKSHGNLPGNIAELVEAYLAPPMVSWRELLYALIRRFLQSRVMRGMRRPSIMKAALKLFYGDRMPVLARLPVFPGTIRDRKFRIVFVIDTSGSMQNKHMAEGLAQMQHIQKCGVDLEIVVLYIDTSVAKEYVLGPHDEIDFEMVGRGGTEFETAFAYVAEMMRSGKDVHLMVYATDGYATPPRTKLPIPCVWIITEGGKPIMPNVPGHITLETKDYPSGTYPS